MKKNTFEKDTYFFQCFQASTPVYLLTMSTSSMSSLSSFSPLPELLLYSLDSRFLTSSGHPLQLSKICFFILVALGNSNFPMLQYLQLAVRLFSVGCLVTWKCDHTIETGRTILLTCKSLSKAKKLAAMPLATDNLTSIINFWWNTVLTLDS
jgi:hypothetical protein